MDKEKILENLERVLQLDFSEVFFSGKGDLPPGEWNSPQNFNAMRISIPLSGTQPQYMYYQNQWQLIVCPTGSAMVFPPLTWTANMPSAAATENFGIILNPGYLRLIVTIRNTGEEKNHPDYAFHQYDGISPATRTLFKTLEYMNQREYRENVAAKLLHLALVMIAADLNNARQETISSSNILCRQIYSYLNEHFREDICREDIAQRFRISPVYVSKLFSRYSHTGSFNRTLNEIRLNAAETLLRESRTECRDISRYCGFAYPSYFGSLFAQKFNMSPKAYREKYISTHSNGSRKKRTP